MSATDMSSYIYAKRWWPLLTACLTVSADVRSAWDYTRLITFHLQRPCSLRHTTVHASGHTEATFSRRSYFESSVFLSTVSFIKLLFATT